MFGFFGIIGKKSIRENKIFGNIQLLREQYSLFIQSNFNNKNSKFYIEDEETVVILQGYLYDKPHQTADIEYVHSLYKKNKNINFISKLNGSFNLLIINKKDSVAFLITDKCGSKPVFVYKNINSLLFGTEVKQILALLDKNPVINWVSWGEYLTFRFTLGKNTFYKGIELMPNGTIIKINFGKRFKVSEHKYWDFDQIEIDKQRSYEAKTSQGVEVFKESFQNLGSILNRQKSIISLSGGYDSRSIVAGLKKYSDYNNFDTVTTLHPAGSEIEIVRKLTKELNINNFYIDRPKDIYKRFFVMKSFLTDSLVQEHLWLMPILKTVSNYNNYIDGMGGDLIMRSTRVRPIHISKMNDTYFLARLFKKQFGFDYYWLKNYVDPKIWEQIRYKDDWAINELNMIKPTENRMLTFLMKNRVRNGISLSPNNIVGKHVESVILPFFDDRIVNFGLSIPHDYKFKFIYRKIIDAAYPEIKFINSTSDESESKLLKYDKRILEFDKNRREIIADYLEISRDDFKYLIKLLKVINFPGFINKNQVIDYLTNAEDINKIITILDIVVWFNLFEMNIQTEDLLKIC